MRVFNSVPEALLRKSRTSAQTSMFYDDLCWSWAFPRKSFMQNQWPYNWVYFILDLRTSALIFTAEPNAIQFVIIILPVAHFCAMSIDKDLFLSKLVHFCAIRCVFFVGNHLQRLCTRSLPKGHTLGCTPSTCAKVVSG